MIKSDGEIKRGQENLFKHIYNICELCRDKGLRVSQAEKIDIFKSLPFLNVMQRNTLKLALCMQIAKSREDEAKFNRLFETYWGVKVEDTEGGLLTTNAELLRTDLPSGRENEGHRDLLAETETEGYDHTRNNANLLSRWNASAPPLDETISKIAKKLAFQKSRRERISLKGKRIDVRTSLRTNICFGGDLFKIYKKNKKLLKTKLVLLCDVSGSMDVFNSFLLQLMFGIQKKIPTSRTFVFSTKTNEITEFLQNNNVEESMIKISNAVRHWSGGTDIYATIKKLNKTVLSESMKKNTILMIVSDGYGSNNFQDNGSEISPLEKEFQMCKRLVRTLVWINPMYGASTFEVRAAALKTAMPYIDHFLPAFNTKALTKLVDGLMQIK